MTTTPPTHKTGNPLPGEPTSSLLTKEQLVQCLNLPSTRMVDELMRKRRIPYIKLGHKTVRFRLPAVIEAISRLEVHAVK